jgi:amino acid adenylation domain-containing protein
MAGPADSGQDDSGGTERIGRGVSLPFVEVSANQGGNNLNEGSYERVANARLGDGGSPGNAGKPGYWEDYLADAPALELPTDHPRPATLGAVMGVESCGLPKDLCDRVRRVTREAGVEVATAGLAVFALLLHRYTSQEKFAIGARHANERLPILADFSDQPSFRQFLHRLEAAVSAGSEEGARPADLAERLGIEPDPSRHSVFQVAFSAGMGEAQSAPLFVSSPAMSSANPAPGLDLHLELAEGSELSLRLHYNEELFDRATAARMLGHMGQLLAGAMEDLERSPAELRMLTDRELCELLVEQNNATRNFPQACLHELFEATAAKAPEEIAAVHAHEQLSYGELNARANQLAHHLQKRGIGRNARVGICLERSLDFAVAILGVLKAGGTCVPLDPKYPGERLTFMLEDVAAPLVITERGLLQAPVANGTQVLHISELRESLAKEARSNPCAGSIPSEIAYIIYTSGSTGRPRGVLLHHEGLASYARVAAEMFDIRPGDRMLQFCSISFDAALEEIYATWAAGATLVFRMDDISLEPSEFLRWIDRQNITIVDLPTAYWHEWVYAMPALAEKVPAGLRLVIVGGEKASPQAYSTWHKLVGNRARLVNTYGPAEASVVATAYEPKLQPGDDAPAALPIGRPVANARVYLLDSYLNLVPVGVPGELHIGGIGVANGYLNLPQLTEEKFIADIFSDSPSARLYKTGDLAKYLPNGDIEFVGRRDNQVKIRGFRVEPGEIESVLGKHPGVNEAAVVLREDASGNKRLVGYVVRSEQGSATENELRRHVQSRLPEYMVPSEFVFLESMPLTPNGKVNRRALPVTKADSASGENDAPATNDPLQAQLIKIWEELLGRKPIGVQGNFFDLGGHSLLAARLMQRVKQVFDKTLPLAVLLQAPTIEQLATVLREDDWSQQWSSLVAIQTEGSKPPFFMIHGVGGNVVGFREIAQRMKPEYPFYGLQSQGLDGKHACHPRIEDMAKHYLVEILSVRAKGPYHLGGFSLGGLVAYEIARILRARGEEVGAVVLFDTYADNPKSLGKSLVDLLRRPNWVRLQKLCAATVERIQRKNRVRAQGLSETLKKVMRTNAHAAERYNLLPYDGKVTLLRADDRWNVSEDCYVRWRQLAGTLETIKIPATHMDFLREPQVSQLAECLKDCIDRAALGEPEVLADSAAR